MRGPFHPLVCWESHPKLARENGVILATGNGLWFALRHGSHHDKALQTAWNERGEREFHYEVLEKLDEDVSPLALRDLLKRKKVHCVAQFGARALL